MEDDETPVSSDPGITIDWLTGYCPVQSEGRIDGLPFYFRARGSSWTLSIGRAGGPAPLGNALWFYEEPYGTGFEAGWMTLEEALAFIEQAAASYRSGTPSMPDRFASRGSPREPDTASV